MPGAASILRAVIQTDSAAAEAKLRAFGGQLDSTAKKGSGILGKFSAASVASFAAIGVAAVAGIGKAIDKTIELGTETRTLSRQLGLTAEDASRLRVAGEDLGISTDDLSRSFGLFSKNIANVSPSLARYGITVERTSAGQVDFLATLGNVSDKFLALPAGVDRTAFAMNVFGRSGKDLIPLLSQGAKGLDEMYNSAQKFGLVMSEKDLKATYDLQIAQRQLGEAFAGIEVAVGRAFLPALQSVVEAGQPVLHLFDQVATGVAPLVKLLGEGMAKAAELFVLTFKPIGIALDAFEKHSADIGNFFINDMVNPIISGLNAMLDAFDTALGPFINFPDIPKIPELSTNVHKVGTTAQAAANSVAGFVDGVWTIPDASAAANTALQGTWTRLEGITTWGNNAADSVARYLANLANLAATRVPGPGGVLPKFQEGGIFHAPRPGGAGLAILHDNERIVPAGGGGRANAGSSVTVNVHVHGDVNGMEDFERKVETVVVKAFSRSLGR